MSNKLTAFGEFCERLDVPVFDRSQLYEQWIRNPWAVEAEEEHQRRARANGFHREGASRKNQF